MTLSRMSFFLVHATAATTKLLFNWCCFLELLSMHQGCQKVMFTDSYP